MGPGAPEFPGLATIAQAAGFLAMVAGRGVPEVSVIPGRQLLFLAVGEESTIPRLDCPGQTANA